MTWARNARSSIRDKLSTPDGSNQSLGGGPCLRWLRYMLIYIYVSIYVYIVIYNIYIRIYCHIHIYIYMVSKFLIRHWYQNYNAKAKRSREGTRLKMLRGDLCNACQICVLRTSTVLQKHCLVCFVQHLHEVLDSQITDKSTNWNIKKWTPREKKRIIECITQNWDYILLVHMAGIVLLRMGYESIVFIYICMYVYIYIYIY